MKTKTGEINIPSTIAKVGRDPRGHRSGMQQGIDRAHSTHQSPERHRLNQACTLHTSSRNEAAVPGRERVRDLSEMAPLVRVSLRRLRVSTRPVTDVTFYAAGR
jgi:hypothetical protein